MISIYRWNLANRTGTWLESGAIPEPDALRSPTDIWWIDLQAPTLAEEEAIFRKLLPIHTLSLEDITKPRREPDTLPHFPKVEEFPDYLFVVVNPLDKLPSQNNGQFSRGCARQLSAVLTHTVLITHHYEPLECVEALRSYLKKHDHMVERGPDYLFHIALDAMVDEYAPTLDRVTDHLDTIEEQVFNRPRSEQLSHLLQLKRDIIALRKTLILEREVLARLTRGEFALIDDREIAYYRNVYDHLVRYNELIEASREMVTDLMQTHLAAVSNKMNQIMKTLTMISTIILPMSLVAGIYGMNFELMPEIKWTFGYPFSLLLMTIIGIIGFGFFRWMKWI